jgi:hypothetical protein
MAAIDTTSALLPRDDSHFHQLVRRKNWAAREPGVVLVFAIIFVVASLVIGLFAWRKIQARRERKATV